MKKVILLIQIAFIFFSGNCQSVITGIVVNKETNTPVYGAHVLIANTFLGTYSGDEGVFEFSSYKNNGIKTDRLTVNACVACDSDISRKNNDIICSNCFETLKRCLRQAGL